jgi:hypothetical protein
MRSGTVSPERVEFGAEKGRRGIVKQFTRSHRVGRLALCNDGKPANIAGQ